MEEEFDVDEETLKEIAARTKGKYFRATDEESLRDVYSEIDNLERTEIEVKEYTRYRAVSYTHLTLPTILLV